MTMQTAERLGPRPAGAARRGAGARAAEESRGVPLVVALFVASLLVPVIFDLGPFRLLSHRLFLLAFFPTLLLMFASGRAGRLNTVDYLMLASALWGGLALFASQPGPRVIESVGIHVVEVVGGYLVARLGLRSAEDFLRFVRLMYRVILALLPFAAFESITGTAVLLELIPMTHNEVWAGGERLGLDRAQVVFAHPILYGAFVSTGFALSWYVLRPDAGFLGRAITVAPVALATFFSLSAGALLAFVVQTVMIGWDVVLRGFRGRWKLFMWLTAITYVTLDILSNRTPFHLLVDYGTFSSKTAYYRIVIWRHGIDDVYRNPLFGLGNNIESWTRAFWMGSSIDNFWLFMAMKFGIPTFLTLAGAAIAVLWRAGRVEMPDPLDRACRTGWAIAFVGLMLAGGTVHYWTTMMSFFMFVLGAGVWMSSGGARREAAEEAAGGRRRRRARTGAPAAEPVGRSPARGGVLAPKRPVRGARAGATQGVGRRPGGPRSR